MAIHPCCGSSLQRGVKILAIIGIVIGAIIVTLYALALGTVIAVNDGTEEKSVAIGVLVVLIISAAFGLGLSVLLLTVARKRDLGKCRFWLIVSCILLVIQVVSFIVNSTSGTSNGTDITSSILNILYKLYTIWVVYAFMGELQGESAMSTYPPNQA